MKRTRDLELPEDLLHDQRRAIRLEWWTIASLASITLLMFLVMGNSQAMKTAWLEDMLSFIPAISYLVAHQVHKRPATAEYPYGFHGTHSIAFLVGSVALFTVGAFLLTDSVLTLLKQEHPTIGNVKIFGTLVWEGWLMIAVLVYSVIPPVILGRLKQPLAKKLHNKVLFTDADMNRADWLTGLAAILGIIGIGMGWWWADAVAAAIISLDVLRDGLVNLKMAVTDLLDRIPKTVDHRETDALIHKLHHFLEQQDWIETAEVRLREEGQVYFGEAYIIPREGTTQLVRKLEETQRKAYKLHWRIHDLVLMPVSKIENTDGRPEK